MWVTHTQETCTRNLHQKLASAVRIFEILNRIEQLLTIRFDSKLKQLFKLFEQLFNCDQPGDWDAICLYFASHKPLHSPDAEPSAAPRVCAYPSHSPFSNWSSHLRKNEFNIPTFENGKNYSIRFEISNNSLIFNLIRFKMKKTLFAQH